MFLKISQNSLENTCARFSCNFIKKRLWHTCFPVNFAKFLRTPFLTEQLRWLLLSKMWLALQSFSCLLYFISFYFLLISFQQKNEIKKRNTLMEFKYLLFSRVYFCLTSKTSKEIWQMVIWLESVKENLMLQFSWLEEFH